MKFRLEMTMTNSEGVLERILGRLRQRNLRIHTMMTSCSTDLSQIEAKITVESLRTAEPIMKQLGKLYDVQHMNVFYLDQQETFATANDDKQLSLAMMTKVMQTNLGEQNELCLSL